MELRLKEIIAQLHELADPEIIAKKEKKWAVKTASSLGIHMKELNVLARQIGKNQDLAIQLIDTGIYEARILASKIIKPKLVTEEQMEEWVLFFDNWEICDSFSMAVFGKGPLAKKKIIEWSSRDEEYVKRAAFAILASYTMADKKAENSTFESFYPILIRESDDERIYVKKAINWALRSIGKRNTDLNASAIKCALKILEKGDSSSVWIAKDAIKELQDPKVRISNYPRHLYSK